MTTFSRSTGKRLPISCQACRTRKIRCSRDGRPCQTCVRRGLGAEDCIYLGQPRLSSQQALTAAPPEQNELLARISNLEELHIQSSDGISPQRSPSGTESGAEFEPAFDVRSRDLRSRWPNSAGTLQTYNAGYVRYLPWVASPPISRGQSAPNIETEIPDDGDDLQLPFVKTCVSRDELLAILPPRRYCDALKDIYLRVFSPLFHILHDLTFETEYQQFCHDANSVTTAWLALLFAILSIAVTALEDDELLLSDIGREKTVSRNIKALSARYRSASLRCLAADNVLSRHSINSLQSLILVNYARVHRGLPIWTLLGFTHHVAISMGCHVDPSRFDLGLIEQEERRRAWIGLTSIFTVQNTVFGCLHSGLTAHDVKLPLDINDVDLLTGSFSGQPTRPTHMTYLLLEFHLNRVLSMICDTLFSPSPRLDTYQLEAQILSIREMCDHRYQPNSSLEPILPAHQANLNILYSYIHQLFLLLLRPSLCAYLQGEFTPETYASRTKCVSSARASLAIYRTLHESSSYASYKWYNSYLGSFHAFHAAVVLSVTLMSPETQFEYDESKVLLWDALETFAALSNRSNFCSKAVPVLRQIIEMACTHGQQALASLVGLDPHAAGLMSPPGDFVPFPPMQSIPAPLLAQLQPQNWISPASVPWEGWAGSL
ncbi:Zn(II)2Cys6 transcription factor [Aspergillus homomorphus CBS 101889]|uniref:C6 zinc finger domain protein n=1 Tax=Aspergillus homomorphus (strain CBS 101889) TaxID=1450537 RepID=A0A395I4E3_ASPHC|nr:C6 zinc finger domain protein [Aspergillus homomorphus CBS 101889]RAL15071.1 C6 zinc finger domain protein [Aspergillus homomorphus CBS 101889]